ncbi:TEL2-interacting protein 1 [Cyphellophora attinorum]|uniref:TEL2-interacting protein 1 n=1 Tax=Cyphellophora attinorum TaxID=1664694 RepID=A0A0N0NLY9_9EURO|nr:TEL2-interacting protein 1 [Phialophora attinorum]KPI39851.1 TEL2-interacting protein 1 [Phialophora attinorum]
MTLPRQEAFQLLRPACVDLSSVALRFKGKQATVKQIYNALVNVQEILHREDVRRALDEKLAEYTFFPLTHVFNQAQGLSSSCIESAIACVIVLVSAGWKSNIAPEMAKQLLILMTLLAGGQAKASPVSDEVKSLAFECMQTIVGQLSQKQRGRELFNDVGSKNIVDQLAYLLVEAITESVSDQVQLTAAQALKTVVAAVSDRLMLASLLPRTVSSLTKALRVSTKARRTRKVFVAYLQLLDQMLASTLADSVVFPQLRSEKESDEEGLDEAWLRATSEQVQIALTQVMRLRSHEGIEVRSALATVCFTILQDCPRSLAGSRSLALETLITVAQLEQSSAVTSKIKYLLDSQPETSEMLLAKIDAWCFALPTTLQTSESRPKEPLLRQLHGAVAMAAHSSQLSDEVVTQLADGLTDGLANIYAIESTKHEVEQRDAGTSFALLDLASNTHPGNFPPVLLSNTNDSGFAAGLNRLLAEMRELGVSNTLARAAIRRLSYGTQEDQLVAAWMALRSLSQDHDTKDLDDFITITDSSSIALSRPRLVSDLYAATLPWLTSETNQNEHGIWQMIAIAIESVVLQAEMLDVAYRPELLDSLYPMLALLGSPTPSLREHAITGLNLLAKACNYPSTGDMLIENADYLVNSIGMKLNSFDITPQVPQVLLTMVRLCGASIIPQVDDLIGSIFSALDNFHGHPGLVDSLFNVLRVMVDESKKQPQLAITEHMSEPRHARPRVVPSTLKDILDDLKLLRARKTKVKQEIESLNVHTTPHRPWKETVTNKPAEHDDNGANDLDDEDIDTPARPEEPKQPPLPKSYTLLLRIAQSTAPHLSSPSSSVRRTLLQLLDEVAPLLSHHENSFLPLINSVWPAIVPRLLAYSPTDEGGTETAYNACAAADAIASLCRGAGSFMSTRIEEVAPSLLKLFTSIRDTRHGRSDGKGASGRGAVRTKEISDIDMTIDDTRPSQITPITSKQLDTRSARAQVQAALVRLFSTILDNVQLTSETGDQIFEVLLPFVRVSTDDHSDAVNGNSSPDVTQVLERYNADALWLHLEQTKQQNKAVVMEVAEVEGE